MGRKQCIIKTLAQQRSWWRCGGGGAGWRGRRAGWPAERSTPGSRTNHGWRVDSKDVFLWNYLIYNKPLPSFPPSITLISSLPSLACPVTPSARSCIDMLLGILNTYGICYTIFDLSLSKHLFCKDIFHLGLFVVDLFKYILFFLVLPSVRFLLFSLFRPDIIRWFKYKSLRHTVFEWSSRTWKGWIQIHSSWNSICIKYLPVKGLNNNYYLPAAFTKQLQTNNNKLIQKEFYNEKKNASNNHNDYNNNNMYNDKSYDNDINNNTSTTIFTTTSMSRF